MPQIQILPQLSQQQGFGAQLGQALGGGIGQGISSSLQQMLQQKKRSSDLLNVFGKTSKLYDKTGKGYDTDTTRKIFKRSQELVDQGADPQEASMYAWDEYLEGQNQKRAAKKEAGIIEDRGDISKFLQGTESFSENIKGGLAKALRPLVAIGEFPVELAQQLVSGLEGGGKKVRELLRLNPERAFGAGPMGNLPKPINPIEKESLLQQYDKATLGRGIPETGAQRILSGYPLGVSGLAGGATEEAAKGLGVPEEIAPLFNIAGLAASEKLKLPGKVLNAVKGYINKIPKTSAKLKEAAKVAEVAPEKIIEEAATNLEARGVSIEKVAKGDAKALNEMQREVGKVANTFERAEKFNRKEVDKIRADVAKKLPESPLEKYYAPEKEVVSRSETLAKEEIRTAPLKTKVKQTERSLKNLQYEILKTEDAISRASLDKLPPEGMDRLNTNLQIAKVQRARLLNELKAAEFEIKHKKPPMTSAEIEKQIEKSFSEIKEGIKDPTAEKIKKIEKKLAQDKEAIETAEKLVNRGEIPGPEVFDEYIKIHKQYNKAYGDLVKELKEFVKENKGVAGKEAQVENAQKLTKLVEQMKKAGEAKIVNQVDKRKAMRTLDKPSGAFYRQMLKDLKKDVDAFQRDFFKWKQVAGPEEVRTTQSAKRALEEIPKEAPKPLAQTQKVAKEANEAVRNPTAENIGKLADTANIPNESLGDWLKRLRGKGKEAAEKIKSGKATAVDEKNLLKQIMKEYYKLSPLKRALTGGIVLGTVQGLGDEYFGYKPSATTAGLVAGSIVGRGRGFGIGTAVVAGKVFHLIQGAFEQSEAKRLKSLRNSPEFESYSKKLKEKYGPTKANRIIKLAIS